MSDSTREDNVVNIETARRKRYAKRRRRSLLRTLLFSSVVLLIVLVMAYTFFNRNNMTDNPIRKFLESINIQFGPDGEPAEVFNFDQNIKSQVALYNGGLAVLNPNRLAIYDETGAERVGQPLVTDNAAMRIAGQTILVFDRNGTNVYIYDKYKLRMHETFADGIIAAAVNGNGRCAVLTRQSGYAGVIHVYDDDGKPAYTGYIASKTVIDLALSDDGTRVAVAAVTLDGTRQTGEIAIYDTSDASGQPKETYRRDNGLPVAVYFKQTAIVSLWDDGLALLDGKAKLLKWFDWTGQVLRSFSLNGDYVALQVSPYMTDGGSTVTLLGLDGKEKAKKTFDDDIISIDTCGKWFAMLTNDYAAVYDENFKEIGRAAHNADVRRLLLKDGETVIMIGIDEAKVVKLGK